MKTKAKMKNIISTENNNNQNDSNNVLNIFIPKFNNNISKFII